MELIRDQNRITVAGGQSSVDPTAVLPLKIDPLTGRLLTDTATGGSGTVTSVSVVSANGLTGTVATPTTTPAITLQTTLSSGQVPVSNGTGFQSAPLTGTGNIVLATSPTITGATLTTSTVNGVTLITGGGTTTFLNANGAYSSPSGSGTVNSGTSGQLAYYASTGAAVSGNANVTVSNGALTLGVATSVLGTLVLSGSTSGTTTLTPAVAASGTLTLPSATDTLIGKATTDTLTNKTYDTAGTGNSFKINGTAITAVNGTGAVSLTTNAVFVTPTLGVATATSVNGLALTALSVGFTVAGGSGSSKTLQVNNSLTLGGTDATVMTFPTTNATLARTDAAQTFTGVQTFSSAPVLSTATLTANGNLQTFPGSAQTLAGLTATQTVTNKRITRRVVTTTQSATPTINTDNTDVSSITGLAQAITSFTTNLTGTPVLGDFLEIQITDNGTARAITWGTSFAASTVALPTTTVISTLLHVLFEWDSASSKWICIAVA